MITIQLSQDEFNALVGLLDAGVRATGLSSAVGAAALAQKLDAAQKATQSTSGVTVSPIKK